MLHFINFHSKFLDVLMVNYYSAMVYWLSLLHNFIQENLKSDSAQVQTMQNLISRIGQWSRHKCLSSINHSTKTTHPHHYDNDHHHHGVVFYEEFTKRRDTVIIN